MFTGIIEEIGTVRAVRRGAHSAVLDIQAETALEGSKVGDSIAVNGVCLTVTAMAADGFRADVMHETLNRSSLSQLSAGTHVNLERAMAADGRFGGHIVSGHIDGTGTVADIRRDDNAVWYTVAAPERLLRYIVEKGSVALDGVSLTVASVSGDCFRVSIIPHTAGHTVLSEKRPGALVNIENDIIGKYVERLMGHGPEQTGQSVITRDFLGRHGFV